MWFTHSGQHAFQCFVFFDDFLGPSFSAEGRDDTFPTSGIPFGHGCGSVGLELVLSIGVEVGGPEVQVADGGWQEEGLRSTEA